MAATWSSWLNRTSSDAAEDFEAQWQREGNLAWRKAAVTYDGCVCLGSSCVQLDLVAKSCVVVMLFPV